LKAGSAARPWYIRASTSPGASARTVRSAAVFPDASLVLPEISKIITSGRYRTGRTGRET
jgi:hypothetical protein